MSVQWKWLRRGGGLLSSVPVLWWRMHRETFTSARHSFLKREPSSVEYCIVNTFSMCVCVCVCVFRFQTNPPSLHALVALCVVGCLTLDLTLLQTALLEMNKIIGILYVHPVVYIICKVYVSNGTCSRLSV